MELLAGIVILVAFCLGWTLGYYDIPNLKLSQKDAINDYLEDHPNAQLHDAPKHKELAP